MPTREQMIKRQRALADFADSALRSNDLDEVLTEACRLVSEALETEHAKILEIQTGDQYLFVRAGIGWDADVVGKMRLPMHDNSSESYSIRIGKPVVIRDIHEEKCFVFSDFMKQAGIVAIANAPIILPAGPPYGLLQVDSREHRDFSQEEIEFLRTYTIILGSVIDRLFKIHDLQTALDANRRLLSELQHRVKNHIGIITSFVQMRVKEVGSEEVREELAAIGARIETLRLVHEQLYAANSAERLPLRPYVTQLLENLCHLHEDKSGKVRLEIEVEDVDLTPETAVPLGLILNEFTTNSLKYAFDRRGGVIALTVEMLPTGGMRVHISDNGKGLPAGPRPAKAGSGTGMQLIKGLARQIGAVPHWSSTSGTALSLEFTERARPLFLELSTRGDSAPGR
jgi:two-component sensor histidine kinase